MRRDSEVGKEIKLEDRGVGGWREGRGDGAMQRINNVSRTEASAFHSR